MAKDESEVFGIASVFLGVFSIMASLSLAVGLGLGILSVACSRIQKSKADNKLARWGLVLGSIGIVANLVMFILFVLVFSGRFSF